MDFASIVSDCKKPMILTHQYKTILIVSISCLLGIPKQANYRCALNRRGTLRCRRVVQLSSLHGVVTRRAQAKTLWDFEATWLFANHENVVPLTTIVTVTPFVQPRQLLICIQATFKHRKDRDESVLMSDLSKTSLRVRSISILCILTMALSAGSLGERV